MRPFGTIAVVPFCAARASAVALLLVLAAAAIAAVQAEAPAAARPAVTVEGGPPSARRAAGSAAERWSAIREAADPEDLLRAIGDALVQEGWGRGSIEISGEGGAGDRWRVRLRDLESTRLARWEWIPPSDEDAPAPGDWIPAKAVRTLAGSLDEVQQRGFPFASIQILDASGGADSMTIRARLDPGPRTTLAAVQFEGAGGSRVSYLERVAGLRRGAPIRVREAARARDRLERTALFAEVRGPWMRSAGPDQGILVYRMRPLPQNRLEGAVGYDGARRSLSGTALVVLGNLFGTGRRLSGAWDRIDADRSNLDLGYREPYLLDYPVSADLSVSQYLEDSTWTRDRARGVLEADLGAGWSARAGLSYQRIVFSGVPSLRSSRNATILGLAVDARSEAGTRGRRLDFEMETGSLRTSPRSIQGEGRLVRLFGEFEENRPLRHPFHARLELRGGAVEGPETLPLPESWALGGSTSLRGTPEQTIRALHYGLGRLEGGVRILPDGNRIYGFADLLAYRPWPAGGVRDRLGYGIGVRVRGAGGWVRLDYGIPRGTPPTSGRIHFRLETRF